MTSSPGHSSARTRAPISSAEAPRTKKSLGTRTGRRSAGSASASTSRKQAQIEAAGDDVLDHLREHLGVAPAVEHDEVALALDQTLLHLADPALGR